MWLGGLSTTAAAIWLLQITLLLLQLTLQHHCCCCSTSITNYTQYQDTGNDDVTKIGTGAPKLSSDRPKNNMIFIMILYSSLHLFVSLVSYDDNNNISLVVRNCDFHHSTVDHKQFNMPQLVKKSKDASEESEQRLTLACNWYQRCNKQAYWYSIPVLWFHLQNQQDTGGFCHWTCDEGYYRLHRGIGEGIPKIWIQKQNR